MKKQLDREVFTVDFSCIVAPDDCWDFYADGTMVLESRQRFLAELDEFTETNRSIERLHAYEEDAAQKIANILRERAEIEVGKGAMANRTTEQKRADSRSERLCQRIEYQTTQAREFNELSQDLRAWDNDSDEPRPSTNWRELESYS
jgi:hypothetical protein